MPLFFLIFFWFILNGSPSVLWKKRKKNNDSCVLYSSCVLFVLIKGKVKNNEQKKNSKTEVEVEMKKKHFFFQKYNIKLNRHLLLHFFCGAASFSLLLCDGTLRLNCSLIFFHSLSLFNPHFIFFLLILHAMLHSRLFFAVYLLISFIVFFFFFPFEKKKKKDGGETDVPSVRLLCWIT